MKPLFLIMYERLGEDKPKFHILFNILSKDAKLQELQEDPSVFNIQLFEIREVTL